MLKKNTHSINLKPIIQENNKDISFVCLLMKDEKGLQIRNQKKHIRPKNLKCICDMHYKRIMLFF